MRLVVARLAHVTGAGGPKRAGRQFGNKSIFLWLEEPSSRFHGEVGAPPDAERRKHGVLEPRLWPPSPVATRRASSTLEHPSPEHYVISRSRAPSRTSASRWTGAPQPGPIRCAAIPMLTTTLLPCARTRSDAALARGSLEEVETSHAAMRPASHCLIFCTAQSATSRASTAGSATFRPGSRLGPSARSHGCRARLSLAATGGPINPRMDAMAAILSGAENDPKMRLGSTLGRV